MTSFATEVSDDIRQNAAFWKDLAGLRAMGIRSTLPSEHDSKAGIVGPALGDEGLARLLNSASIFALADDEESRDLAQQIAVFASLAFDSPEVRGAAVHILSGLGNFPGLKKVEPEISEGLGFHTHLRSALLKELASVEIDGSRISLTDFQLDVWEILKSSVATAISAPTSAGKSFVVLEHLAETAIRAEHFVAMYIAPTRALLAEIQGKLERRLAKISSELRITTIPVPDPEHRAKQIYVLTQERAQLLLSAIDLADAVDLVIIDEAQAIGDDSRGMILQDVIEKIRKASPSARFLFLAPGATGFDLVGESVGLNNLDVMETGLSPVVQNRISVNFPPENEHVVHLDLVTADRLDSIGSYTFDRGFALDDDQKLAAVAEEFGASGRSLVYATGAKNAEDLSELLALNRKDRDTASLNELAKFIEQHVHKRYSLARFVRRGVAFHYGNMPSLLREGIETSFREGHLDYLCCTTTLFQGVNLPARNVFIDTPTRGNRGELLEEASLWNFAGRAGRLGEEVVGNVFLVNYEKWEHKLLTERKPFQLKVAFKDTIENDFDAVVELLDAAAEPKPDEERKRPTPRTTAAAGLVLFRAAQGSLESLLDRPNLSLTPEKREQLSAATDRALANLGLPESVLTSSWMVDPVALASLLERLRQGVHKKEFAKLMPVNPSSDVYEVYNSIFRRLYKHLGRAKLTGDENKGMRGYVNHVTVTALKWMRGDALTQLVNEAVRFKLSAAKQSTRKTPEQAVVDGAIRDMFVTIEQTIRFTLVQWAKAYVDLLKFVLVEKGYAERVAEVYDFSLALELGVSTTTGRSLIEFGLSRITAAAVAGLITDSSLTPEQVKEWIRAQPEDMLSQLSGLVLAELRSKELLAPVAAED
ncbi:TPA: DEAD/DEAH box helicase [Pseudomonas aeruginosa]|nr:DEAD/DEAH box helicase [Pseudomonas aeruginosa]